MQYTLPKWHSGICRPIPEMQETGLIAGMGRSPGVGNGSIHRAWKIPLTEAPGGLQSMESRRVGHDSTHTHLHTHAIQYDLAV